MDGATPPDDLEVTDGVGVDLVERRVTGITGVAAVHTPLAGRALLRRERRAERQAERSDGRQPRARSESPHGPSGVNMRVWAVWASTAPRLYTSGKYSSSAQRVIRLP